MFQELLVLQQFEMASKIRADFGIEKVVEPVGPELIEQSMEERRKREEGNFQVPATCPVHFIDSLEELQKASDKLKQFYAGRLHTRDCGMQAMDVGV